MIASNWVHLPTLLSLGFIITALTTGVLLSLRKTRREARVAG